MQSIVSKGKNIKEAIKLGLELMELKKNEVSIEIQQQETRGLMGIGGKEAIVKLTRVRNESEQHGSHSKDKYSHQSIEEVIDNELDSDEHVKLEKQTSYHSTNNVDISLQEEVQKEKVWVENGQLYVKDSPTQYPTVSIGKHINIIQNDEAIQQGTIIVSENDHIKIKCDHDERETKWKVSIDQKKLEVTIEIEPGYKINRIVQDVQPAQHIKLVAEEHKEIVNTLSYEDIFKKMESLHVKYGFEQAEILKAIETTELGIFVIAKGKKATPGENGKIELKVDVDTKNGLIENEVGEIDFRESKMIPTVDQGKVVAVIHPPIPGNPGVTVTNEPLPAKQTHPIALKIGKGVTQVDDKIVATESGRPVIEQRGMLVSASIMPKLVHRDPVNLSSGNIHFNGDVEVLGEIEETMIVEAGGDIVVHKSVHSATLTSLKSLIVKGNVIGSELSAGKNNMLVAELGHLLGIMKKKLDSMIAVINQITQSTAFKSNDLASNGIQPLIHILLEKKFQDFVPLIKKYVGVTNGGEQYLEGDSWRRVSVHLTNIFLSLSNQVTTVAHLHQLSQQMEELYEFSQTPIEPDSYITVSDTLNSHLYSSGDITIIGQGSINSKVHAGGELRITGVLRGGEVYGRMGVNINEVGSDMGTKTIISVPYDQSIHITKALEDTVLKIGNVKHVLKEVTYDLKAKLDKDGRMKFEM
ncbi:FapA family protein [Aquibacillus sediminis]|uniref:FapA family protein n=1 Tax=Aquibacillus sediminis TaxID=2574734 RepID=UPI001107FEC3|nr:FapA family protein [Aquibacillus sediminis]